MKLQVRLATSFRPADPRPFGLSPRKALSYFSRVDSEKAVERLAAKVFIPPKCDRRSHRLPHPEYTNSIQDFIDDGTSVTIFCHGCNHRGEIDLMKLRDRLEPDHGMLFDEIN